MVLFCSLNLCIYVYQSTTFLKALANFQSLIQIDDTLADSSLHTCTEMISDKSMDIALLRLWISEIAIFTKGVFFTMIHTCT